MRNRNTGQRITNRMVEMGIGEDLLMLEETTSNKKVKNKDSYNIGLEDALTEISLLKTLISNDKVREYIVEAIRKKLTK